MPDANTIDAFLRLGVSGVLVVAVIAFFRGWVRVGALVDADRKAEAERRDRTEARLIAERDAAVGLAASYAKQFERALDIIEGKVPSAK